MTFKSEVTVPNNMYLIISTDMLMLKMEPFRWSTSSNLFVHHVLIIKKFMVKLLFKIHQS